MIEATLSSVSRPMRELTKLRKAKTQVIALAPRSAWTLSEVGTLISARSTASAANQSTRRARPPSAEMPW